MIDNKVIEASAYAVKSADNWGVNAVSVFFALLFLLAMGFFLWFIVKEIKKSVDNNTTTMEECVQTNKEIVKSMQNYTQQAKENMDLTKKISNKQDMIHFDIKEILNATRYKYHTKGFENEK